MAVGTLQCNCSVVGDESSKNALVVDPGGDVQKILNAVEQHGLKVKTIALTHGHLDHLVGAMELKRRTGAHLLMAARDESWLETMDEQARWLGMPDPGKVEIDGALQAGTPLRIGKLQARIIATPGHTEGSVSFYFEKEGVLLAGDLLFAGGIGRTDLPGGSQEEILRSLAEVMKLPDETRVIPGHGPETTIGAERKNNPHLPSAH